ncbi:MAG: CRTAC1 family protein [Phycisphaerae bacterium]|jgi:enediyne biosynthesis protein E4|nr:CRTAC1 family protein [Phycisphaerae bacterium]
MMKYAVAIFLCCVAGCSETSVQEQPKPWFENEAEERGFTFVYESGFNGTPQYPEIFGGGSALLDVEGDGDLDIYVVQGGSIHDPTQTTFTNQLFINDGNGYFTNASKGSGAEDNGFGMGAATGDYDGDGDLDIYVTNVGRNTLLRNNNDGTFTDVTVEAKIGNERWGSSSVFFDMDKDGDLDLYVANYIDWNEGLERECKSPSGILDYCHPDAYGAPSKDVLYRNNGDGTFIDVSEESGIHAVWGNGLGVTVGDVNDDGLLDVFVANDEMNNQLWMNQGDGTFIDDAIVSGVAVDANGEPKAGMGTDFADVDNDGNIDLLVVNLVGQSDSMFMNQGGWFEDGTPGSGLSAISRPYTRFGTGFRDLNNDGILDVYMANGRVLIAQTSETDDYYAEDNVLIQGVGDGKFKEVTPKGGVSKPLIHTSRGAAYGDVNNDGGIDIVVVNRDGLAYLLVNQNVGKGNFAILKVLDRNGAPAQDATMQFNLGGKRIRREVRTSGGYVSAHDATLHIGMGKEQAVSDVEITWSDGSKRAIPDISVGEILTIRQSK